jgi:hypothetical protein
MSECPREQITQSFHQINPIDQIFQRHGTERKVYSVAGPTHFGVMIGSTVCLYACTYNHMNLILLMLGHIAWGVVIRGFMIVIHDSLGGMEVATGNSANTVFGVILRAANKYRVPSRVRGDHGGENVATFMEWFQGEKRDSYI